MLAMIQPQDEPGAVVAAKGDGLARAPNAPGEMPLAIRYWRTVLRWKWVIGGCLVIALALGFVVTLLMTPLYTATATTEIARQEDKVVNVQGVQPETQPLDLEFYQTQYSLMKARSLAERVAAKLKLADNDRFFDMFGVKPVGRELFAAATRPSASQRIDRTRQVVDILVANIDIAPIRGSRLVNVSFTSPDPETSAQIVNTWTGSFIAQNLDRRFEATTYARSYLEGRLADLRQKLEESERQLVAYATQQRIVNIPVGDETKGQRRTERPLAVDDLTALNTALSDATSQRILAESRLAAGSAGASAEALANPAISSLRQKRAEVASDYAKLLVQFEPGYPAARALAMQISQLDSSIAREEKRVGDSLRGGYTEAKQRERELKARVEELKNSLLETRGRSIQYNIYQRDLDTSRELYDGLLQRYKEIGVAAGVGTNNVAVVDPARVPDKPSSPKLGRNLLIALLLGMTLAGIAVFALEQVDEGIDDPAVVAKVTGLPLLGTVPAVAIVPLDALSDRKSAMSEAYLSVRTSLGFSTDHGIPRAFMITSARAAEGKSTSALALAQTIARTGLRVALIDADMRSPSLHQLLGVPNVRGVSNFLAGDDAIADMVFPTQVEGCVGIPAGPAPPNAAELLSSPRLGKLIARLLETHDHVVVDSPPVLGLADAPLLSAQVEAVVFAIEARGTPVSVIRTAIGRLQSANANLVGVVLTKFDATKSQFGYGYDYGYGYGATTAAS